MQSITKYNPLPAILSPTLARLLAIVGGLATIRYWESRVIVKEKAARKKMDNS
jgi:hypothetical protein